MLRTGEDSTEREFFRGIRGGPRPSAAHWLGGPEPRLFVDNDLSPISLDSPIDMKVMNVGGVQAPSSHSTPSSSDQFLGIPLSSSPQFPASPQFSASPRYQSPISRRLSSHERYVTAPRMSPERTKVGRPSSPLTLPASPKTLRLSASPKRVYALGSHGGLYPGGIEDRSPMQLQTPSDWGTPLPGTTPGSRNPAIIKHLNQQVSDNMWMRTCGYSPPLSSVIPLGMLSSWEQHQQQQQAMANERKIQKQMEQQMPTYEGHSGYESIGVLAHHDFGNASIEDDDSQRNILGRRHSQHAGLVSKGVRQGLRTKVDRTKGGVGRENGVPAQYGSEVSRPVVRLRGLPFAASESEIMKFFTAHGINIVRNIEILKKSDGRPSGQARVTLDGTDDDAYSVQNSLQWQWMGNRYIEVFVEGDDDRTLINKKTNNSALTRQHFGSDQGRVQNGIGAPLRGDNADPIYGKQPPTMGHTGMPPAPQGVGSISLSPTQAAVGGNHSIAQADHVQKNWNDRNYQASVEWSTQWPQWQA